ncbi:MAG: hypothetical protein FJY92_10100 [Candidatus Hydrogenedentes bacterium]|nr:hypothetical protein [Candidatus Hydrogenedentota bacterium]
MCNRHLVLDVVRDKLPPVLMLFTVTAFTLGQAPTGQVAYVQQIGDSQRQVCVLDVATGQERTVSAGPWDGAPVWSPDGSGLAFEQAGDGGAVRIRVVSADGTPGPEIAHAATANRAPAWSPDGKALAYRSGEGDACRIRVYDFAAGAETQWGARDDAGQQAVAYHRPAWESATEIVAVGVRDDKAGRTADLYTLEQDTSTLVVQTRGGGMYVEWSPAPQVRTGTLAYESNDGGDREIFVVTPQRGVIDISNHRAADWAPVWSPDGAWLAFESFRGGARGIYKASPQRTVVATIAADAAYDNWSPAWSPDGAWLAFVSTRSGKPGLYVCGADGSDARAMTDHDAADLAPAWRPAVTK